MMEERGRRGRERRGGANNCSADCVV